MWLKALREQRVDLRNAVAITVLVLACLRDNLKWCIQMGARAACAQLHTTEAISWHLLISPNWHTANYISTHARRRPTLSHFIAQNISALRRGVFTFLLRTEMCEAWTESLLVSLSGRREKQKGDIFVQICFARPCTNVCVCVRKRPQRSLAVFPKNIGRQNVSN